MPDLCIVGAGPVGATLALALADADLDVRVLDARDDGEPARGDRTIALSHGARLILERAGVWQAVARDDGSVTPITTIDVSQAGGFGLVRIDAAEQALPALGYVVAYRQLQAALDAVLAARGVCVRWNARVARVGGTPAYASVELDDGTLETSRLAVVADGTGTAVDAAPRYRVDYRQVALVAALDVALPHGGVAYERFTSDGPIALLPQRDGYGLIWTTTPERAQTLAALPEPAFVDALKRAFGPRASAVVRAANRRTFPLVLEVAASPPTSRALAIGNASQTLHPVAGQGVNLGLRDAYELARVIVDTPRDAIGSRAMLDRFARARRPDRWAGVAFTHGLVGLFAADAALVRWPRGLALSLLDVCAPAKRAFTRAMLYGLR